MFRNPRDNVSAQSAEIVLPSTGRPPTPPANGSPKQNSPYFSVSAISTNKQSNNLVSPIPVLGRQPSKPVIGRKGAVKQNQSILSFFGKAEKIEQPKPVVESELFFDDDIKATYDSPERSGHPILSSRPAQGDDDDLFRFNEDVTPVKRRKVNLVDHDDFMSTPPPKRTSISPERPSPACKQLPVSKTRKSRGGFVDDSSDEEENGNTTGVLGTEGRLGHHEASQLEKEPAQQSPTPSTADRTEVGTHIATTTKVPLKLPDDSETNLQDGRRGVKSEHSIPSLAHEATSMANIDDFGDEDFEDEEFYEGGEEYLERRWLEEQREMEAGLEDDSKSESVTDDVQTPISMDGENHEHQAWSSDNVAACPMCSGSMKGLSESEASAHVNACLDGTAKSLSKPADSTSKALKSERSSFPPSSGSAKRFQRAAIARPAQANPFSMAAGGKTGGTAFTKLMTGHAEDAAWAEAAANEMQSRGKPAYQRTCPFYKIMPGLYICVDAFRYGKVEGQNAYFLSHFHSDHYIGLTAQWCHGPIYASKITCNLMRQQLKVDAKWIHPLEFEKRVEVPETNGVFVTMIPANHCPGSSLYLFEKQVGNNKDGSPKFNRILHCGDFRACPAHVNHPLLMPDVMDAVTGQTKQQIIDTCYLDTTYLTPKYSFPCQSDVIDACANMCVSLSKEIVDSDDSWEKVKLAKAGSAMKKFLEDGKQEIVKKEDNDKEEIEDVKPKVRGRLLVVIGTYSIGKERICLGIARALKSKIYAPPSKMRICKALEDADLNALLTSNPLEAQVHMQMLMEIRAETLHDYLITFKGHFHRVVGFRPTGWTYRPPTSRFTENPAVSTVLHSEAWKSRFTMHDLAPQRGSTRESNCFGVPYSEHSSFRELTMFCCALRVNRVIPTVNVGSAKSRERMKAWIEKWDAEKKKNGLFKVEVGAEGWGSGDGQLRYGV